MIIAHRDGNDLDFAIECDESVADKVRRQLTLVSLLGMKQLMKMLNQMNIGQ